MDRQKLEASATYAALVLLAMMLLAGIVAIADGVFRWDLLDDDFERVVVFLLSSTFALLVGCVLVSVMLNLSILAQKVSEAVDRERRRS